MVKFKDYYETLGVSRSATDKEIKAAYRKLAREHHPDANAGNKRSEEKFKELAEAYEVLKDSEKRRRYDMLGANWKAGADFTPPPGAGNFSFDFSNLGGFGNASPFSDFFDMLFGQTFGQSTGQSTGQSAGQAGGQAFPGSEFLNSGRQAKAFDQEADIELTIEELARGAARNIQVHKPGKGVKTLKVKIPAGVRSGSRVRVPGEAGQAVPNGQPGDLFLKVKVKPHPYLTVEGDNVVSELPISSALAVIGGEALVTTLDGPVHINIPPLSQAGRLLRLRERGLPKPKQTVRGDHLVRLKIVVPANVTPEEKSHYEALLEMEKNKTDRKTQSG